MTKSATKRSSQAPAKSQPAARAKKPAQGTRSKGATRSAGATRSVKTSRSAPRKFEAESPALMSLRLLAAPNPEDDLTDAELSALCHDPRRSPELIQHLIDFVKGM